MKAESNDIALALLGTPYEALDEKTRRVARHVAERKHIAKDMSKETAEGSTLGQRAADAVATFGGSWTFIGLFAATLVSWVGLNSFLLARYGAVFDAYPYILLNLVLSMLAAIQAPIILMSQNRQAQKDRQVAEHDYEVNLKAELEIMLLHEKIDLLREGQWTALLAIQQEQIRLLEGLVVTDASGRHGDCCRVARTSVRSQRSGRSTFLKRTLVKADHAYDESSGISPACRE
jgi:uncharacterized membrane protein